MIKNPKEQEFSKKEAQERFDAMLKGALKSPPKPLKDIPKATAKRGPKTKSANKPGS